jgi:hypothetical protein
MTFHGKRGLVTLLLIQTGTRSLAATVPYDGGAHGHHQPAP